MFRRSLVMCEELTFDELLELARRDAKSVSEYINNKCPEQGIISNLTEQQVKHFIEGKPWKED
jgi:hypothetical protein